MSLSKHYGRIIGIVCFVVLVFLAGVKLISRTEKIKKSGRKNALIVFLAITVTLLISKLWLILTGNLTITYTNINHESLYLSIPAVLASLLTGILVNFNLAIFTGFISAAFVSIQFNDDFYIFMYVAVGSIVASFPMAGKDSRIGLVKHGLIVSASCVVMTLLLFFLKNETFGDKLAYDLALAFINGVAASFCALFLLPLFEYLFDITTDLKLLELSNMNHPALKELMVSAPGSYQHSIMVGNLAEAAALKVRANPLFCRVASYYHDIGKGKNPDFFIENCTPNRPTVHAKLDDPHLSARTVIRHVEHGVKLAKEYRLGRKITEIIKQHHGTTLTQFFYVQAKEKTEEPAKIDPRRFRYPGPKPQTLASAIIMLADSCEAAVRSIQKPTPAKIDEMIRKVCAGILRDGQLDQSGISLKQFKDIIETFQELLVTIYHQRIAYPEEKVKFPTLIYSRKEPPSPSARSGS